MFQLNKETVTRGQACQIGLILVDAFGVQIPICGVQGVKLEILNEDNSRTEKQAAGGMTWGYGETTSLYYFNFTAEETELFELGEDQAVAIRLVFPNAERRYEFKKFLTVLPPLSPELRRILGDVLNLRSAR
jgi:hypothetical protein